MPALIVLAGDRERQKAIGWIKKAPVNSRVTFASPKRALDQSARMWASLTQIAEAVPWHGTKLTPEDFKVLFMASLNQEMRLVPNLDGTGFVPLGRSSSKLSREDMGMLLDLISAFAAQHGVELHE